MRHRDDHTAPLDRVFRENLPSLYRLAYTLLRQREEAEDAVQDAWLKVARAGDARTGVTHPRGWMFRVLRNLCIDRLRARRTHLRLVSSDVDIDSLSVMDTQSPGIENVLDDADTLARTMAAMDRMPGELAEILTLVVVEEMSYREVATVLEIPVGTVRSRLNRARQHLRTLLDAPENTAHLTPSGRRP